MSELEQTEQDRINRNEILKTKNLIAEIKAGQGLPTGQIQRPDSNVQIIVVPALIPSLGLVYPSDHPLYQQDSVDIKAMTAKEENILMSKSLIRRGTVINELLKSCILDKAIDVLSLLSGDRMALIFAIRGKGYGDDFVQKMTCPECEATQEETYLISEFKMKDLDLTKVNQVTPGENIFSFMLPVLQKEVYFKFLTGKDEESIVKTMDARKKNGLQNDESVTTRLLHNIVAIDGKTDKGYITPIIQNLPARDSRALRTHIEENEPGVDTSREFICNSCGYQGEMTPPMGVSFLWPPK